LNIDEKDTLLVINKIDAVSNRVAIESVLRRYPRGIPVSAQTGEGIDRLKVAVSDALSRTFRDIEVETHVSNGRLLAYLAAHGEIMSQTYDENQVTIHCRLPQKYVGRLHDPEVIVRDRASGERLNVREPEGWERAATPQAARQAGPDKPVLDDKTSSHLPHGDASIEDVA
jgi:GTPase